MVPDSELKKLKDGADKVIRRFSEEIATLRVGRPTSALVEGIPVDYYGSRLLLKELATILVQPPNILVIQPWDKNAVQPIEKALNQADIGALPTVDGNVIRIVLPPLTAERRQELIRILGKKTEEARISFRMLRDETRKVINQLYTDKKISEDEKFIANEKLQKETDEFNKTIEELAKRKEEEILKI